MRPPRRRAACARPRRALVSPAARRANHSARFDVRFPPENGGQTPAYRKISNRSSMKERQCVGKREQRVAIALRDRRESSFEAVISPNLEVFDCQAALASRIASRPQFRCVTGMVSGFESTATLLIAGTASLSKSTRLGARSSCKNEILVAFPPGRAKLETIPASTGSPLNPNTTGTDFAAKGAAVEAGPPITIRTTFALNISSTKAGNRL